MSRKPATDHIQIRLRRYPAEGAYDVLLLCGGGEPEVIIGDVLPEPAEKFKRHPWLLNIPAFDIINHRFEPKTPEPDCILAAICDRICAASLPAEDTFSAPLDRLAAERDTTPESA